MKPSPAPSSVSWTQRALFFLGVYGALAALALWFAYELRFNGGTNLVGAEQAKVDAFLDRQRLAALLWVVPLKFVLLGLAGQFRGVFYYFRLHDAIRMAAALLVATLVMLVLPAFLGPVSAEAPFALPRGVTLVDFNLSLLLFVGFRVSIRTLRERFSGQAAAVGVVERLVIVGAGRAGEQLVAELRSRRGHGLEPVCFVDDDPAKHGLDIHGVPVVGAPELMPQLAEKFGVSEVILALPSNSAKRIREVSALAARQGLRVLVVPSMADLAGGRIRATDLRPVSVEDLLGRPPAQLDDAAIGALVAGRTVLVTGAGGSIGLELCRQVAARQPARLLLLDQCEVLLYQAEQELIAAGVGALLTPLVGDVTDEARLREIFGRYRPELVLHAAAHKHVPLMESQPGEALKNNVLGTALLARLAGEHDVARFVLVSSDKAVNPTNVMGASKRLSELAIQAAHGRPGNRTRYVAVRFGNVLASSGSVIPIFRKQIAEGGPVTVTHPEVRRYFMTIPEAVGLVLQSAAQGEGGDILVLEMGEPLHIVDLARQLIELSGFRPEVDIEIRFIGLRPGEKLVEELQLQGEHYRPTTHPRIHRFVGARPEYAALDPLLESVRRLTVLGGADCKRGLREILPEYTPSLD